MIPLTWLRGIIAVSVISIFLGIGYLGYSKIKQIGYLEAETKYTLIIKGYQDLVDNKIKSLEKSSTELAAAAVISNELTASSVQAITKGLKGKTLTIIKNGECTPSKDFSDSFNKINSTVNQNMKGNHK